MRADYRDIVARRLRVVAFAERHLTEMYLGWLNDTARTRYSEQRHRTHTMESSRAYLASFRDSPNYFWAIEQNELGHIGNINAYVDEASAVADIGIIVGPEGAGHGYGLEAWKGVCHFLLQQAGMRKVSAGTLANNVAMLRLAERSGMSPDGVRKAHALWEGEAVDIVHFALFADPEGKS